MNYFIKNIRVNELLHLKDFDIPIGNEKAPHLMITGKNGSGKTILLNAIAEFFKNLETGVAQFYSSYGIRGLQDLESFNDDDLYNRVCQFMKMTNNIAFQHVDLQMNQFKTLLDGGTFISYYKAKRYSIMLEPKSPTKPKLDQHRGIDKSSTDQFLYFLSDLKVQEALARVENQLEDADGIKHWFENFEELLGEIYEDKGLKLEFNYRDYSFRINTGGKRFKFTEMSDGYAAIMDIVADLVLTMQDKDSLTRVYDKRGIVLIDEIETHLHLELQKNIMPILTRVFPNVQFIVTTHSPFVLNSIDNAVAFDLEHREVIEDLTQYSYSALAEGYFGVSEESSYMKMQLDKMRGLLGKEALDRGEVFTLKRLVEDFERIPEPVSPNMVGEYLSLKGEYMDKLKRWEVL